MNSIQILAAAGLTKKFRSSSPLQAGTTLTALDNISLQLAGGETLGIAGESGCGKSTLAKIMAGLIQPDTGTVSYKGVPLTQLDKQAASHFRRTTQMVFQDPFSSLNPRMRVGDSITEPLLLAGKPSAARQEELHRLLAAVGLPTECANRFPDEFSGGQRQRIGIARALAAAPEILIADEPVSALDISIQAQIINILMQLKSSFSLSLMIVSHNLLVLRHMCDRIIIMYLGAIVECGPAATLFQHCRHPYTEALLAAIPGLSGSADRSAAAVSGDLPSAAAIPSGCRFHPRCRHATEFCRTTPPLFTEYTPGHGAACHHSQALYP